MSRLEQLIAELCPDGVEFKELAEIAIDMYRGSGIKRDQLVDSGTPCVRYGEIYTTFGVWFDQCVSFVNEDDVKSKKYFEYGDVLFAITGESVEEIGKSSVYVGNEVCLAGGDIVVMKHDQNPKYMAYALSTSDAQFQKSKGRVKSKVVHTNIPALMSIVIPVPPLPIQREIVRILEEYTKLEAELETSIEAELETRAKQYEYYRDALLAFDSETEAASSGASSRRPSIEYRWMNLGDVIKSIKTGLNPRKNFHLNTSDASNYYVTVREIVNGQIVFMDKTDRVNDDALKMINNRSSLEVGDVLFSGTGTVGRTAVIIEEPTDWNIKEGVYVIKPDSRNINPQFLSFVLNTTSIVDAYKRKIVGSPVISLPMADLNKLKIPIPPLEEQERIVAILDRFDALINDLTTGLPAEIAARRKQYEYYRDKLITFQEQKARDSSRN